MAAAMADLGSARLSAPPAACDHREAEACVELVFDGVTVLVE